MSRFQRVQQWSAFSRKWHIYDARWQNPFHSAKVITPVLEGKNKPIYHPLNECGDHVIVINSRWERGKLRYVKLCYACC